MIHHKQPDVRLVSYGTAFREAYEKSEVADRTPNAGIGIREE
jgi:hypothetical protein